MKPLDDVLDPERSRRHANARTFKAEAEARKAQAEMWADIAREKEREQAHEIMEEMKREEE